MDDQPLPTFIEVDRLLSVIEAPTADASAKIAAAERLTAIIRVQFQRMGIGERDEALADVLTARRVTAAKVNAVRELRNRLFADGNVDVAEQIDRALGDNPVTPAMADTQRSIAEELMAAKSRISELEAANILPAVMRLVAERKRQIAVEGYTPAHDDVWTRGELAAGAGCYAFAAANFVFGGGDMAYVVAPPKDWPFGEETWMPANGARMLEKAGAMIIAELERLERAKT